MSENNRYLTKKQFSQSLGISPNTLGRYLKAIGVPMFRGLLCPKMQNELKEKLDDYGRDKLKPKE